MELILDAIGVSRRELSLVKALAVGDDARMCDVGERSDCEKGLENVEEDDEDDFDIIGGSGVPCVALAWDEDSVVDAIARWMAFTAAVLAAAVREDMSAIGRDEIEAVVLIPFGTQV